MKVKTMIKKSSIKNYEKEMNLVLQIGQKESSKCYNFIAGV